MNAYSQEELSDEQKKVVGVLFDKYATVAGAWFVNNNCSILNEKENSEFFWYTSEFTKIVSSLKNPKMVTSIQKSAKKVSEQDKYKKCGEWAIPMFPKTRSVKGSPMTPYIFASQCSIEDAAITLMKVYKIQKELLIRLTEDANLRVS